MNTTASQSNEGVVAYCRTCGKPLGETAKREVYGVVYCEDCLASRVMGIPAPPPNATEAPRTIAYVPSAPNPGLAFILGFIPGVGAMYNGQVTKGFVHVGIFALIVSVLSSGGGNSGLEPFFGILLAGFIGYMVFDALQTAKALRFGQPVPDYLRILHTLNSMGLKSDAGHSYVVAQPPASSPAAQAGVAGSAPFVAEPPLVAVPVAVVQEPEPQPERVPFSAIVLIGIGLLFLLSTLDVFYINGRYFFPILLIALGVWLAVRRTLSGANVVR